MKIVMSLKKVCKMFKEKFYSLKTHYNNAGYLWNVTFGIIKVHHICLDGFVFCSWEEVKTFINYLCLLPACFKSLTYTSLQVVQILNDKTV